MKEQLVVIDAFELGFNLGNAVKYLLRADRKGISMRALGYMEAIILVDEWAHPDEPLEVRGFEHAQGIGEAFGLTADIVIELAGRDFLVTLAALIKASPPSMFQIEKRTLEAIGR